MTCHITWGYVCKTPDICLCNIFVSIKLNPIPPLFIICINTYDINLSTHYYVLTVRFQNETSDVSYQIETPNLFEKTVILFPSKSNCLLHKWAFNYRDSQFDDSQTSICTSHDSLSIIVLLIGQ